MRAREFSHGGYEVGCFEDPVFPTRPGRYRYIPYRGKGHKDMGAEIRKRGFAIIEFGDEGAMFRATAQVVEYGLLELSDFSERAPQAKQN